MFVSEIPKCLSFDISPAGDLLVCSGNNGKVSIISTADLKPVVCYDYDYFGNIASLTYVSKTYIVRTSAAAVYKSFLQHLTVQIIFQRSSRDQIAQS